MDTLATRWAHLEPHVTVTGPDDALPRPTALLFHGCGGIRGHLPRYAEIARTQGWRAYIVDSYAPRGWSRTFAMATVCTGLLLRGWERAGDIVATIDGVSRRADVDASTLLVAGWSHGAWSIMDLMAQPLTRRGELGLRDAPKASLDGIRGGFFAYPYVGVASASRGGRPWPRPLRLLSIVPRRDHLASVRRHMRALASAVAAGSEISVWSVDATHAFDEPGLMARIMRYDEDLSREALERFAGFLSTISPARPEPRS
jgi:dienelactone hydrolase